MRGVRDRVAARVLRLACAALAACLVLLLCAPTTALAQAVLEVRQTFSTTGEVPTSVTGEFAYRLTSVDGAPLPGGEVEAYEFSLAGDDAVRFVPMGTGANAMAYAHAGVYAYELECLAADAGGYSIDRSAYGIRVSIENDGSGGLVLGWVEVVDLSDGAKPDGIVYRHSYAGEEPMPSPESTPTPGPRRTPSWMPHTGDAEYAMLQLSAVLLLVGLAMLVIAAMGRRRSRRRG